MHVVARAVRPACEQNPSSAIEPKPSFDQAARLRAALAESVTTPTETPCVEVTGAKGGVGTTTLALALRDELALLDIDTIDRGRDLPGDAEPAPTAWVLVVTPEPAALAAAFDAVRSVAPRHGPALIAVNRSPSFARSLAAFERLSAALDAVGSNGTVFAGHIPLDSAFGRQPARGRGPAARSCGLLAGRLAEYVRPTVPAFPGIAIGAVC